MKRQTHNQYPTLFISLFLALVILAGALLAHQASPAHAGNDSAAPAAPEAFELRYAYYYKPPENITTGVLAQQFSFFILSKGNETFRDELLALGGRRPMLQYIRFEAIHNPGPNDCTRQPWRNNAAYNPGDFCAISKDHPDWFLLDQNGERIVDSYQDEEFYLMDPLNRGWQDFFISRVKQSLADTKWDGTFLDNVEVTLSFRQKENEVPVKYPTDAQYLAATQGFLQYMYTTYFRPNNKLLYANIVSRKDDALFVTYLDYLDGAMHEGWSIDNPNRWRSVSQWEKQMSLAEQAQAQGKFMVLVGQGTQADYELQRFAYASFLLVTNGSAAFRYGHSDNYRQAWYYDNYRLNLGAPLGARYKSSSTAWRRDYTNGYVMVDPTNHLSEIKVTGGTPPTANPTATAVPPTAAPTKTALPPTATATKTAVPPTATATKTAVPPTATATKTAVPPTATATKTAVPPTTAPTHTTVPPTGIPSTPAPLPGYTFKLFMPVQRK